MVIRGGIYQVDFGAISDEGDRRYRGHEQRGRRYGILMSPPDSMLSVVSMIPTSTSAEKRVYRPEVEFDGRTTRVLIEQTRAIDRRFVGDLVGYIDRVDLAEVEAAFAQYFGLMPTIRGGIGSAYVNGRGSDKP